MTCAVARVSSMAMASVATDINVDRFRISRLFWQRHLFGAAMALHYIALHSDILRYHVWIVLQSSHAE